MWYSQGTITATNNKTVINGVGTDFLQGVRVGDGITIQGSAALHEVMSIASATQMTIRPAYTGATGAGKQYAVAPILGYDKDLSDAFNRLRLQFGDKLSSLQPWAHAATASAALDALGFSVSGKAVATGTAEQGRVGLGLGTAALDNSGKGSTNENGQLVKVGPHTSLGGDDVSNSSLNFGGCLNPALAGQGVRLYRAVGGGEVARFAIYVRSLTDPLSGYIQRFHFPESALYQGTQEVLTTGNTTKDSNGFVKMSSPVINLYTDHHDLHNESQFGGTPTVTRKSKGVHEITGTLGLRSEGWYLDTPNDRNGNKYFNVEWTQNIAPTAVDGIVDEYRDDIVVTIETFERVWNKETGMFENGAPIDINEPQDRFVQLRFNEIKVEHEELGDDHS